MELIYSLFVFLFLSKAARKGETGGGDIFVCRGGLRNLCVVSEKW